MHQGKVQETKEVGDGIFLDYDEENELRGIEILYAGERALEIILPETGLVSNVILNPSADSGLAP